MMPEMEYGTIAFQNTHTAMQAQAILQNNFSISVMPTLRALSMSCGISVRFLPEDAKEIVAIIERELPDPGSYRICGVRHEGNLLVTFDL